nr:hypothetical protein [uncultured Desulfobacter sp.]
MDESALSKKIPADEDLTRLFHLASKMMIRMHHCMRRPAAKNVNRSPQRPS